VEKSNVQGGSVGGKGNGFVVPYIEIEVKEKWCSRCRSWLPFSEYSKNRTKGDGYGTECKRCSTQYQKEWKNKR
jgi:hypothetical protein